jgi:hypothetical protein
MSFNIKIRMITAGINKISIITFFLIFFNLKSSAQLTEVVFPENPDKSINRRIAFPFLTIQTDSRTAAMGEAGAALVTDAGSLSTNASKLGFFDKNFGISFSYVPWLSSSVDDVNLLYLSTFLKIDDRSTIGASLRYFSYGDFILKDHDQSNLGMYSPSEFAIDITYIRKFGEAFSIGSALRYIHSALPSGGSIDQIETAANSAWSVDVSAYGQKPISFGLYDAVLSAGMVLSNLGSITGKEKTNAFLPTNLKIGVASRFMLNGPHEINFALDWNKPIRDIDSQETDYSVKEQESFNLGLGTEYTYHNSFSVRAGYLKQFPEISKNSFYTFGGGFKKELFSLDIAYLLPNQKRSPLANTIRLTILLNFENQ